MKFYRVIITLILLFILIIAHSIVMTLIKNEDFVGTYNITEIKSGIIMEINGSSTRLIDKKEDKTIVCDIDSIHAYDDVISGKCNNGYFLLTISNKKVIYSSIPMSQSFAGILYTPREYYAKMTECIDNIGLVVLILCAIVVITIGMFSSKRCFWKR